MTSRLLLSGMLAGPLVRKTRRDDGRLFGIARLRDTDRTETRFWTVFVNDPQLIERFEGLRVGEPVAVTGPFSFAVGSAGNEPTIEYRITAEDFLDTKRKPKSKAKKAAEQRVASDEADLAPRREEREELNDPLPF